MAKSLLGLWSTPAVLLARYRRPELIKQRFSTGIGPSSLVLMLVTRCQVRKYIHVRKYHTGEAQVSFAARSTLPQYHLTSRRECHLLLPLLRDTVQHSPNDYLYLLLS